MDIKTYRLVDVGGTEVLLRQLLDSDSDVADPVRRASEMGELQDIGSAVAVTVYTEGGEREPTVEEAAALEAAFEQVLGRKVTVRPAADPPA